MANIQGFFSDVHTTSMRMFGPATYKRTGRGRAGLGGRAGAIFPKAKTVILGPRGSHYGACRQTLGGNGGFCGRAGVFGPQGPLFPGGAKRGPSGGRRSGRVWGVGRGAGGGRFSLRRKR